MADAETVAGLAGEHFADLLAQAWVSRGWETDVVEDDDGTFLVTGDQGGQRGLILVFPGNESVPGQRLQQFASLVSKKSVDVPVVATQGTFSDDAERIANANDIHLLRPPDVAETIESEGLADQLSTYASDGGSGSSGSTGDGLAAALPIPLPDADAIPVPGGMPSSIPKPSLGGSTTKAVLVAFLVATSLLVGFAGGAFLLPGQTSGTSDVPVAALSTATNDAGLTVHWNARTADAVTANGSSFTPPDGQRFVVVQFVVTNTGNERVPVRGSNFLLNANATRYSHQPLDGARTFPVSAVAPGNTTTGWLVYAIPTNATDAVLVPHPDTPGGPVRFVHDPSLTINGTA